MSDQKIKKKPSGAEYRKRKREQEKEFHKAKKLMNIDKYIAKKSQEELESISEKSCPSTSFGTKEDKNEEDDKTTTESQESHENDSTGNVNNDSSLVINDSETTISQTVDLSDVGNWPDNRNNKMVDHLITLGPSQVQQPNFPKDESGRHFTSSQYFRKLPNNETILRRWLVYSPSKNRVFCFCCRLFNSQSTSNLTSEGFNNWKHLSEILKTHENSALHKKYHHQWFEREIRLKRGNTIDCEEQKLINRETLRWNNVLTRLMNIVLYLAENNMAFRGSSDKLYTRNNGKFLGLVELLGKFDPIMEEHLKLATTGGISDHYCGKDIQNELIHLMGEKVTSEIISRAKNAKYYSIIADCTPDISHVEQLSLTIRFADLTDANVAIKEHFIEFIPATSSTGAGLTEVILSILKKHGLEIANCRGQGYDNGANMKGKNIGVQKRILDLNPLAFYVPCGCHSYNLVLCDAAKSSVNSVTLFGILQRIFTLFSASVNRWKILTDHVELFSVKKLSDTRWEAKINSVKSVRYQICEIHDALVTLANVTEKTDHTTSHEASTLAEQLKDFGFILSLVVWYEILFQINVVSKSLQSQDMDLGKSAEMLENCCNFFEEYRKTGFKKAYCTASDLAKELQVNPEFKPAKRLRRIKRQAGEIATDEPIESPEKKIEVEFFNKLLDVALMSIKERFQQLKDYSDTWSFLHDIKKNPEKKELAVLCANLQQKLTVGSNSDIDGDGLCDELISLKHFLPGDNISCITVLNFIRQREIQELYPNVWIAFRIFATIPVTVASGERSFSKLKLIKTYLRSTTSQSRLSNLATLSIENEIAGQLDFSQLIRSFADKKARKVKFY